MEIKVNDYVRLDNGNIGHVIAVEKGSIMLDIVSNRWVGMCCIKKHSQNLIDLIEVGDYVNGKKVLEKTARFITCSSSDYGNNRFFEYQIKSIVTKEQFSSLEYII